MQVEFRDLYDMLKKNHFINNAKKSSNFEMLKHKTSLGPKSQKLVLFDLLFSSYYYYYKDFFTH